MDQSSEGNSLPQNPFKRSTKGDEQVPAPISSANDDLTNQADSLPGHASARGAAELESREVSLGKDLARTFKEKKVHPVFIFGSKGSGKTSLIASILKYMRDREEAAATIELAEWVIPEGDEWWAESTNWSRDMFYKKVFAYIDNTAPEATQEPQPFFVPVKVTRKSGEEVYFAFLEGKGEWYQPNFSANVPFRRFKGFLQGVLQNFNEVATVVYIAPFVTGSSLEAANSPHLRASDLGLLGAIDEYLSIRKAFAHQDQHLFLVTKWDIYCESIASHSFIDPQEADIQAVLRERYPLSWTRYLNANVSDENQNKGYSAYCSGLIDGNSIVVAAEEDDENVAFYARKLWDWLYENAVGGVLYPDVRPKPPGRLEKILQWLRR